jgi:hypothetical protein
MTFSDFMQSMSTGGSSRDTAGGEVLRAASAFDIGQHAMDHGPHPGGADGAVTSEFSGLCDSGEASKLSKNREHEAGVRVGAKRPRGDEARGEWCNSHGAQHLLEASEDRREHAEILLAGPAPRHSQRLTSRDPASPGKRSYLAQHALFDQVPQLRRDIMARSDTPSP